MLETMSMRKIRSEMLPELPTEMFHRTLSTALLIIFYYFTYIALFLSGITHPAWIPFVAILLGLFGEMLSMAAHDVLHGSVVKSNLLAKMICLPIAFITLISPSYWRFWHDFHHRSFDRFTPKAPPRGLDFETEWLRGHLGWFELLIYKQVNLIVRQFKFLSEDFRRSGFERRVNLWFHVLIELGLIVAVKLALFWQLPFTVWLGLEALPYFVQSFFSSVFVVTQHSALLDPMDGKQIRFFSVDLPKILEKGSFHLGYHFEHHLFPNMPSSQLPKLRTILESKYREIRFHQKMEVALRKIYFGT